MKRPVYICSIQHVLGEPTQLETLAPVIGDDLVSTLLRDGLQFYRVSDRSASQLAFEALALSLNESPVPVEAIDLVVFCSLAGQDGVSTIPENCVNLGLNNAQILGLSLADCTNLAEAMRLAAIMIASGEADNIAIVTADKVDGPEDRLTQLGAGILSDGAAAMIMTSQQPGEWRFLASAAVADQRLRAMHARMNYPRLLALSARRIRETVSRALSRAEVDTSELAQVVMTNLKASANAFVVTQSKAPLEQLYTGSLASTSHAFAADPFINLAAISDDVAPGSRVLMIALSPYNWSATVLERSS